MQSVRIANPAWVESYVRWDDRFPSDEDKMRLAIALSHENVIRRTGGPFGAAIFEAGTGRLIAVGVNSVVRLNNCTLHGEMMAFMMAQSRLSRFTLAATGQSSHELATSCEPCAMCLGAALWSGVRRIIAGAAGRDARAIGFDEGPVFPESYAYLAERQVEVAQGVLREEARAVLTLYQTMAGPIYNGIGMGVE